MKKILVPVDFSTCALNALNFARNLAAQHGYALKVVHVYSGQLNPRRMLNLQAGKTQEEAIAQNLENFVAEKVVNGDVAVATPQVNIEIDAVFAMNTVSCLTDLTKDKAVEMVVMGTTGAGDLLDRLLGSVSSNLAQQAACPVILVPKEVVFHGFKSLLYASNYESIAENRLEDIIQFGQQFHTDMHFVHIEANEDFGLVKRAIFKKIFEEKYPNYTFTISKISGKNPLDGLNEYAEQQDLDLIVLVNRQRKSWENIFGLSLTKQMAFRPMRPMMVLHLEDQ